MTVIQVERRQDESQLDYHKRLIYGKLVDKTLADVDYTELAELAYGQSYSSDVARRMFYGSRRTLELMDAEKLASLCSLNDSYNNEDALSEIDAKIFELRKERQKFYDQRREFLKLPNFEARHEHLVSELCNSAKQLSETVGALYHCDTTLHPVSNEHTEAVLVFSDWHYGLKTENIFNKYDTDICKQRVKNIADRAAERLLRHQCNKLHIVVLGDLIHGAIHTSARVASEEYVCDQLMQASEILAQTVEMLSTYVNETVVYVTYGNHARTIQSKNDSIHRDNMERLVPWWLEQRLFNHDNIIVKSEDDCEFIIADSCGHDFCATHGDNDSVKTSPRLITTLLQKKRNRNIEYILLGDKHHRESFDELGVTAFLCGSLCGTDDYANNKRLYSEPSQLMLITTPEDGVDAEYRIKCN